MILQIVLLKPTHYTKIESEQQKIHLVVINNTKLINLVEPIGAKLTQLHKVKLFCENIYIVSNLIFPQMSYCAQKIAFSPFFKEKKNTFYFGVSISILYLLEGTF